MFVRENISCKIIKIDSDADFERIFVEINLRKKKWLLCCSYNPHKSNITNHLTNICNTLDKLSANYEYLILLGDFNVEHEEESIAEFLNLYNLKNLVKQINPHLLISCLIKIDSGAGFERIFVEINLRKKKWLLCCSYNPHKSNITNHLTNICKTMDKLSANYDNLILLGDFNVEHEEESIAEFLNLYNLKNLVKQINPHVLISYLQIALVVSKIQILSK